MELDLTLRLGPCPMELGHDDQLQVGSEFSRTGRGRILQAEVDGRRPSIEEVMAGEPCRTGHGRPIVIVPEWVRRVVDLKNGYDIRLLYAKTLTGSDVQSQQNRLLIRTMNVKDLLIPALDDAERRAIGIDDESLSRPKYNKKKKPTGSLAMAVYDGRKVEKPKGLRVSAYTRTLGTCCCFKLNIIRWDSSHGCVINGKDWKDIIGTQGLRPRMRVQVWSFRTGGSGDQPSQLNVIVGEADHRS